MGENRADGRPRRTEADWLMRPRVEDIDTVLDNALDLLEDSKRCKGPGALALAELSLEQASLAALLWGRSLLDRHGVSGRLGKGESCFPLSPFIPAGVIVLAGEINQFTDPQIMLVSKQHPPSLRHVESVLRFMEGMAPYVFDPERVVALRKSALPLATRIQLTLRGKVRFSKAGKEELAEVLEVAKTLAIPALDRRKNELLYAQIDRDTGHASLTDVDDELLAAVTRLSGLLQEMIVAALNAADAVEEKARKVEGRIRLVRRIERATGVQILPPGVVVRD